MSIRMFVVVVSICAASALPVQGQDLTRPPAYGSVRLADGFTPNPHVVPVGAGGRRNPNWIAPTCVGRISDAPDYQIDYVAGGQGLEFSVQSPNDTILVINMPDGRWTCDDDGGPVGYNPQITLPVAPSGTYRIWVGTGGAVGEHRATLNVTQIPSR